MKLKNSFKGFTLVEVLIVIIIVGILIAALLPRLTGSQARARDTARAAHINQIAQAAALYSADNPSNTLSGCSSSTALNNYLASRPTDPSNNTVGSSACAAGTYAIYSDGNDTVVVGQVELGTSGNCDAPVVAGAATTQISTPTLTPGSGSYLCNIVAG